jgi:hypothetical protein
MWCKCSSCSHCLSLLPSVPPPLVQHPGAADEARSDAFTCPAKCNETLLHEAALLKPVYVDTCSWRGVLVDLIGVGEPLLSSPTLSWTLGEQTYRWLGGAQHEPDLGLKCAEVPRPQASHDHNGTLTLLLVELRMTHMYSYDDSVVPEMVPRSMRLQRLCVHFALVRTLLWRERMAGRQPVVLLNLGGEALSADTLVDLQHVLASCGIDPQATFERPER